MKTEETNPESEEVLNQDSSPNTPVEENLDWKDRALRAQAEMQNMKRRLEDETEARTRRRMEALLMELITVADHMDLAMQAAPEDLPDSKEGQAFLAGMSAIRSSLDLALRAQGLEFIQPQQDDKFDPEIHQAVETKENVQYLTLIRKGYRFGKHILRPAQVHLPNEA